MAGLRIKFPNLTSLQQEIAASDARFNLLAGGVHAGKSTLALDIFLTAKMGA